MMIIEDEGIILSIRQLGERHLIVSCILSQHGNLSGLIYKSSIKTGSYIIPGNIFNVYWYARLEEQLGYMRLDIKQNIQSMLFLRYYPNSVMHYFLHLVKVVFKERDPAPAVYALLKEDIFNLAGSSVEELLKMIIQFEYKILAATGYGLNLESCALTGQTEDLAYISPKSGAAATRQAAQHYHNRLLIYPRYFKDSAYDSISELYAALKITGHFLQQHELIGEALWSERSTVLRILLRNESLAS